MVIKTKVDAVLALDRLKNYTHDTDCKLLPYINKTMQEGDFVPECNCGSFHRNNLIEEIKKFVIRKK
jgi:hypothetical protein